MFDDFDDAINGYMGEQFETDLHQLKLNSATYQRRSNAHCLSIRGSTEAFELDHGNLILLNSVSCQQCVDDDICASAASHRECRPLKLSFASDFQNSK